MEANKGFAKVRRITSPTLGPEAGLYIWMPGFCLCSDAVRAAVTVVLSIPELSTPPAPRLLVLLFFPALLAPSPSTSCSSLSLELALFLAAILAD